MKRNIITIDEDKCTGCGLCVNACQEGALQIVNGKAKLVSESYCDGLGNCLPQCPAGAITIEEREAAEFDEEAVKNRTAPDTLESPDRHMQGCPGSRAQVIKKSYDRQQEAVEKNTAKPESQLQQWPCQIKLVPVNAPYFDGASLLVAADCTAYAYANIHSDFMKNKITLIGCPKLDSIDYSEKLTQILQSHEIKSLTVLRMEVPCCGGLVNAVRQALLNSGKMIPWRVVIITTDGKIIEE